MNKSVHQHHRATIRRIQEMECELDCAIRHARSLAQGAPGSGEFDKVLNEIAALNQQIKASRRLAVSLSAMLPKVAVRLVPPARLRVPTPRPHHARAWAKVMSMTAQKPTVPSN